MKRIIVSTLITISALAITSPLRALENNALYQWTGKDGTPTYSPEPPPAGVDYVVVDADLNPLPVQQKRESATAPPTRVQVPLTAPAKAPPVALYQWTSKNGTPTYSPEPPQAGVDYVVVDADLNPLPVQPKRESATTTPTRVQVPLTAPAKAAPVKPAPEPKWKPVMYAEDPALKPIRKKREISTEPNLPPATDDLTVAATKPNLESDECLVMKRDKLVLESAFSKAKTDAQMDQAILKLKEASEKYNSECR